MAAATAQAYDELELTEIVAQRRDQRGADHPDGNLNFVRVRAEHVMPDGVYGAWCMLCVKRE